ncbi:MAG: glutamine synthetase family protein [Caldilineaceae bacterium]
MQPTMLRGMLTTTALAELVQSDQIDTVVVAFTDLYGRLMGKRFDAEFFVEQVMAHGTHGCDYLLTVDMEMEPVQGYRYANWELGYGDFHLVPDLATLRVAAWQERTALVLCDIEDDKQHSLVPYAPRSLLRQQLGQAEQLGYGVMAASELEFYTYANSYRDAVQRDFANLEPVGWYIEDYHMLQGVRQEPLVGAIRRHLRDSGVPVENSKGEWGLGQHELNVRYTDALAMADRHIIYKQCAKEVAEQMGMSVTFMAKPVAGQAGSSCHIHLSLWAGDQNAFAGDQQLGPVQGSDLFRWFLGGWIAHAPELMVCYAPTINSYKRFEDGSWAPTRLAWSYDNRTAGFRVIGHGSSLRIECRIPGADCNPYLAYAAALASGLDGIANQIEPPEIFVGDIYAARHLPRVPYTLREAIALFAASDFTKAAFGADVVEHYTHFFQVEQAAFDRAVTDWERKRYFERI